MERNSFVKRLSHHHRWLWQKRGLGIYRKGKQNVEIKMTGFQAKCECGKEMFFPDNPNFYPVDTYTFQED